MIAVRPLRESGSSFRSENSFQTDLSTKSLLQMEACGSEVLQTLALVFVLMD
jgi:hypothetical protein